MHDAMTACEPPALTGGQRDDLAARLDADGYAVLPGKLPEELRLAVLAAIDRYAAEKRSADPAVKSIKANNCVDLDPAFRRLMMYTPALQMAYDAFGPCFHLNQSNFQSRPCEPGAASDFIAATGWHADGPRSSPFPAVAGPGPHGPAVGLHYLKFGYFLTDLTHGNGGSLRVVRGSHKRPELDGKRGADFDINDYRDDLVQFDCEPGAVVAFHQAQWHAAPANLSDTERRNVYISYCATWMRPFDRDVFAADADTSHMSPEEAWLLGEYRPPTRWWLPTEDDRRRLANYAPAGRA